MRRRPIEPHADKAARVAIDRLVLAASGIRSVVLCNTMIYGNALGAPAQSVQIPALVRQAKASGVARYIGRGLNRWSNVHIADVAALYALAIAKAPAGTFMYVESGEEAFGEIVQAIAAQTWSRRCTILVRRGGDRRLGSEHGGVLARLEQPRARQSRGRSRLVADPALDHEVDRRRTHLGLGSRRIASRERGSMANFGPGTSRRTAVPDVPPRLTPTLLTIGWPARSSRRHKSACHTNGAWPYCADGMGDTSHCGPPRGSRKRAGKRKRRRAGRIGPLRRVRRTEPGIRCVAHLRLSALGPVDWDGTMTA